MHWENWFAFQFSQKIRPYGRIEAHDWFVKALGKELVPSTPCQKLGTPNLSGKYWANQSRRISIWRNSSLILRRPSPSILVPSSLKMEKKWKLMLPANILRIAIFGKSVRLIITSLGCTIYKVRNVLYWLLWQFFQKSLIWLILPKNSWQHC